MKTLLIKIVFGLIVVGLFRFNLYWLGNELGICFIAAIIFMICMEDGNNSEP